MAHFRAHCRSLLCALLCALGLSGPVWAQDGDRIWGQVHTKSGEVHEGFIRWDRNEGSWVDILDGSKEVPGENYLAWLESKVGLYHGGKIWNFGTPMDLLRFKPLSMVQRIRVGFWTFILQKNKKLAQV